MLRAEKIGCNLGKPSASGLFILDVPFMTLVVNLVDSEFYINF